MTVRSTTPAVPDGVIQVIEVAETTVTNVQARRDAPNRTLAPVTNPVPVIVIAVPPASLPDAGVTPVIVGATANDGAAGSTAKPKVRTPIIAILTFAETLISLRTERSFIEFIEVFRNIRFST
ncbi:unannotated protein [freshwater metagenome]|uniref:Unannotated protein n=1 Tax=freshwater metagenome TaxID=449393 RepID=A0A6J6NTQ4_9ZZZZ